MKNFHYSIKTDIHFGRGAIEELPEEIKKYGQKVLLVYGGGSIRKIGLYDRVLDLLNENNIKCIEISGVEPNPRIDTVRRGVRFVKGDRIDVILPIGGGSTIDCAKAIAAGGLYDGDPWDLIVDPSKIEKTIPIISVLTLAATGSEMDAGAVISNLETKEKLGFGHWSLRPKSSILDPEYTYTVPKNQTAAGTADIMSHIFEVYFSNDKGAFLQDRMCEALLKTCIHYGPIAYNDGENYEARANLMWASSLGINGLLSSGKGDPWTVHPIEHELSAYYDITHGVGLAILTPHWMEYVLNEKTLDKFVEFGINVWDIDRTLEKEEIAKEAIKMTKKFFNEILEIPSNLRRLNITEEHFEEMAGHCTRNGNIKGYKELNKKDIIEIYKKSL
ncbi:iron-containing alcohol dehydrogenase [uncultured Clostridium sp.]|uniref:iron-containing alcohol dehydrogenase n=1 Tax=uncultured Clostridium sp. TaxID=59620 RepID=UPI00261C90AE|nr:iron-containing alcohol dehydrogenase [uncultured Clostridium sp.]